VGKGDELSLSNVFGQGGGVEDLSLAPARLIAMYDLVALVWSGSSTF